MSEQGWQEFLAAEDVDGLGGVARRGDGGVPRRVAGRGGTACRGGGGRPGLDGAGALMTIAEDQLTVRLTRDLWQLEQRHVHLARAVSAVARAHGAVVDRAACAGSAARRSRRSQTRSTSASGALSSATRRYADDNAVDPLGHGSTVWMQELDPAKPLRHAMHVDVSVAREQAETRVAAALAAGGRIVEDSHALRPGSSPTAPATAYASPRGPTVPPIPTWRQTPSGT